MVEMATHTLADASPNGFLRIFHSQYFFLKRDQQGRNPAAFLLRRN
jgi:hypothetical protein